MKTIIILSIACMTLSSFSTKQQSVTKHKTAEEVLAVKIITAFQSASADEYVLLFPSLQEFHQLMDRNTALYGDYLTEAKHEFTSDYTSNLLPQVKHSFQETILLGKKKGIDWNAVEFIGVTSVMADKDSDVATIVITFRCGKQHHHLYIKKAMMLPTAWRASQFISLD